MTLHDATSLPPLPESTDVLVVGSGIVGCAHALAAVDAGYRVTMIDRDEVPVGASIRNFGHACVTGQVGELAELAYLARERWLEVAERIGFFALESGALTVARSGAEMGVLEELRDTRGATVELLGAQRVKSRLGSQAAGGGAVVGGAFLADDLRVDPREAVPAMVRWLSESGALTFVPRTSYLGHDGATVYTSRGSIRADKTYLCVGHDLDYVQPDVAAEHGIERCALVMHAVRNPGVNLEPAVLTGTSMLRYDAFAQTQAAAQLRAEMADTRPDLLAIGANVMFTQRPDGTLLVGDSHEYAISMPPFMAEDTSRTLLREVAGILGVPGLEVTQRWQGVYASSPRGPYLARDLDEHVRATSVTSGVGMTISFGLAHRALAGQPAPSLG